MRYRLWQACLWLLLSCAAADAAWAQTSASASVSAPALAELAGCNSHMPITQARRSVFRDRQLLANEIVALPDLLPLAWRNEHVHITYTLDVSACAGSGNASLWTFRTGAPFQVSTSARPLPSLLDPAALNPAGDTTSRFGPAMVYNGRMPALFALPRGAREVQIDLLTLPYIPAGLTLLALGPTNLLTPLATQSIESVVGHADAAAGVMLVLALMAMVLWLQRPHDMGFLWMTLACVSWSLRALAYFGSSIHMPALWFEQLNPLNILLTAAAMCAATLSTIVVRAQSFSTTSSPDWRRMPRRVMLFMVLSGCAGFVAATALGQGALLARAYAQTCALLLSLWTLWWLGSGRLRMGRWHRLGIIAGYLGLVGSAAHDMWLVTGILAPTGPSYLFWGFTVLLVVYAVISGDYIIATLNRAENTNHELELRVAEKSTALEHSYAQLRQTELAGVRASAQQQERERLLRDMHDGLGAQLMTALRGVERAALSREQIAQSLLDGLDELRMLMDSTDMGGDLSGALAAWRNRWDARLDAAGVQLHWHLDDSLEGTGVSSDALLQIMRVLQEAATNVVKHAQAANMHVEARLATHLVRPMLQIELRDDGVGLPDQATRPGQRGLQNMQHRAGIIGAQLEIGNVEPPASGCRIRLALPILVGDVHGK